MTLRPGRHAARNGLQTDTGDWPPLRGAASGGALNDPGALVCARR